MWRAGKLTKTCCNVLVCTSVLICLWLTDYKKIKLLGKHSLDGWVDSTVNKGLDGWIVGWIVEWTDECIDTLLIMKEISIIVQLSQVLNWSSIGFTPDDDPLSNGYRLPSLDYHTINLFLKLRSTFMEMPSRITTVYWSILSAGKLTLRFKKNQYNTWNTILSKDVSAFGVWKVIIASAV